MRKVLVPVFITFLFASLAGLLYAAANTEPTKPLPPEDTLVAKADFPAQDAKIQIWQTRADLLIKDVPYTLYGNAVTDKYGAVELLEGPTGNNVVILPDGSCDVYLNGVQYRFE